MSEKFELHESGTKIREIELDEARILGRGAHGAVYQYKEDSIVKINFSHNGLDEIIEEKRLAREAFILGMPTAISFGVVKVGDRYGLEYEFIKSSTLSKFIMDNPEKTDECVRKLVELAKTIHKIEANVESGKNKFPSAKKFYLDYIELGKNLTAEQKKLATAFINSIPDANTIIHSDLHTGNCMLADGELMLIDMGDVAYGHPIFDLACAQLVFIEMRSIFGFKNDEDITFVGISVSKGEEIWEKFLQGYFAGLSKSEIERRKKQIAYLSRYKAICQSIKNGLKSGSRIKSKQIVDETILKELIDEFGILDW